ncbi:MAG: phosphoribosylaminoimidazolesuccinocarboxamide synthase [Candidatus Dormibacteraeota bacterium]|nr:phosphoribosylaminoimidazolesuccinocarboxamide synthase [Candidatus Dormibacteraeota bacterium]
MSTDAAVLETSLELPLFSRGKVRDTYELDSERLLMVATDRISAFDWVLPSGIPDRGKVLTQLSIFWFERTRDLLENHLIEPGSDGRSMVVRRAQRIDFECVVRGYLAGSAWAEYRKAGTMAGEPLPPGLRESERLPEPLFTPATKAETGHDENITFERMASEVGGDLAGRLRDASLRLYSFGLDHAEGQGLILADTKFEFGLIDGRLVLIDEALTPDSSRYWDAAGYRVGSTPESFDKQFVRDWLSASGWDRNSPPPDLPPEIVEQTRQRYLTAYERLTGKPLG